MSVGFWETLATTQGDCTAITAASRTSALTSAAKTGLYTLPSNRLKIGDTLNIRAFGRISCVVTTPGTARFDLSAGVGGTAFWDSAAIPLNIVAQTTVPWTLDVEIVARAVGSTANFIGGGQWLSGAALNVAAPATGPGPGGYVVPYNTTPAVGSNVDLSVANIIDFNFTQTVATGSFTLHQYTLSFKTSSGM